MPRPRTRAACALALLVAAAGCEQDKAEKQQLRDQIGLYANQQTALTLQQSTLTTARDQVAAGRAFATLSAAEQTQVNSLNGQIVATQQQLAVVQTALTTSQNRLYELEHGTAPPAPAR